MTDTQFCLFLSVSLLALTLAFSVWSYFVNKFLNLLSQRLDNVWDYAKKLKEAIDLLDERTRLRSGPGDSTHDEQK